MKPGSIRPRHVVLGLALAGAAMLAAFGDMTRDDAVAEAAVRPAARPAPLPPALPTLTPRAAAAARAPVHAAADNPGTAPQILPLIPREVLIADDDAGFGQGAAGVFSHQDWTPPPPPPAPAQPAPPPPPPPAPVAPPLPFTFIGKSVSDGAWEVYLARGNRTYVVRDKEVIDGMYRVQSIAPPVLLLIYLPLNQVQQLNIGVFD